MPRPGGLEVSLLRTARMLALDRTIHPIVYIRSDLHDYGGATAFEGIDIVPLAPRRAPWEAPLLGAGPRMLASERCRLDFLLLRDAIAHSVALKQDRPHVVVSFFIMEHGFVAQQVAGALGVAHIACVRGTDFSRGFHDPITFPAIDYVARSADLVVTTNREQHTALSRRGVKQVRTITSSVPTEVVGYRWTPRRPSRVRVFATCGYSHKKGTQVLLRAVEVLRTEGIPVELTITGTDDESQQAYWSALRDRYGADHAGAFTFLPHIDESLLYERLCDYDLYCSATLGEGCSLARLTALVVGIPIVTTACGEMVDLAENLRHVRLSPPADEDAFITTLRDATHDILNGTLQVDPAAVARLRAYLTPARERAEWLDAIRYVTNEHRHAEANRLPRS